MNTLRLTCLCEQTDTSVTPVAEPETLIQEIGDIPNTAISGIVSRINQINAAIEAIKTTLPSTINLDALTTVNKYAAAIKYAYGSDQYFVIGSTTTSRETTLTKIIGAELIVQETTNIYNYAQVGA